MPEYNPAVALDIKPPENNLAKTFDTISNIQQAQAHTGLYTLQAAQQQRQLNALQGAAEDYRAGKDPLPRYLGSGGDPAGANTLQNVFAGQRAMQATPGGLMPAAYEQLQGAREKSAQTSNLGVQHGILQTEQAKKDMELRGSIAQSLSADTSDENWKATVPSLAGHVSQQGAARIMAAMADPSQRRQVAQSMIAAAMPTAEATRPQPTKAGEGFMTPLEYSASRTSAAAPAATTASGAPAAMPALTAGNLPGIQPTGQREQAGATAMGGQDAKYTEDLSTRAKNARSVNTTLANMSRDAEDLPLGKGMATAAAGRAWLQSAYDNNVLGAKTWMTDPGKDATAAYDSLVKNSGILTRQALMQTHERAAMAYTMIQKQLPNIETSRGGFSRLTAEWGGLNDDDIYKQRIMASRPVAGRSDQFEAEWNANVNPVAFMLNRMNKADRAKVIEGLKKTDDGQQVLSDVSGTIQYLHAHGIK